MTPVVVLKLDEPVDFDVLFTDPEAKVKTVQLSNGVVKHSFIIWT